MRRKDREVLGEEIFTMMDQCSILSLAMVDGGKPYVATVNFGLVRKDGQVEVAFHCAGEGRKLSAIAQNPNVAFTMVAGYQVQQHPLACSWSAKFQSVYGEGLAELVPQEEKIPYFNAIMQQAGHEGLPSFDQAIVEKTTLVRIKVTLLTGKAKQ